MADTKRTNTLARLLAENIAVDLCTNGADEKATRLVLELEDGRDGGGRCYANVVNTIHKSIAAAYPFMDIK